MIQSPESRTTPSLDAIHLPEDREYVRQEAEYLGNFADGYFPQAADFVTEIYMRGIERASP